MCGPFYLRPEILARICADPPAVPAARSAEWRRVFADAEPALVDAVAAFFPATSAETFARWVAIRSPISAETELLEPLLQEETDRLMILPIRDHKMWEFREKIVNLHWVAQEVDLTQDDRDRERVSPEEFHLLSRVLTWFGPADEAVMAGLDEVATTKVRRKEGLYYFRSQAEQECVHSEAYALQILNVLPAEDQDNVSRAAREDPLVARAADWVRWWVAAEHPVADFFAAMAFIEGVLFSGFFAALQYFKLKGVFPGITTLNEYIARDEGVHTLFWCFLLNERLLRRPDESVISAIAHETTTLSSAFFAGALPKPVMGLNADLLNQYVRYVADTILIQTGYPVVYNVTNPLPYMDMLSLNEVAKSNFFEFRSTQYQNLGTEGALDFAINESPIQA